MDPDGYNALERAAMQVNLDIDSGNTISSKKNKKYSSLKRVWRRGALWAINYRKKGSVQKHIAGAVASFYIAPLGPKTNRRYAKKWGVGPAYFTKWHTTLGYGTSFLYEHGPLFGASQATNVLTGISQGDYFVFVNFVLGTTQNLVRATAAFGFNQPVPVISLIYAPLQVAHYRKGIKNKLIKIKNKIKRYYGGLMRQ